MYGAAVGTYCLELYFSCNWMQLSAGLGKTEMYVPTTNYKNKVQPTILNCQQVSNNLKAKRG